MNEIERLEKAYQDSYRQAETCNCPSCHQNKADIFAILVTKRAEKAGSPFDPQKEREANRLPHLTLNELMENQANFTGKWVTITNDDGEAHEVYYVDENGNWHPNGKHYLYHGPDDNLTKPKRGHDGDDYHYNNPGDYHQDQNEDW